MESIPKAGSAMDLKSAFTLVLGPGARKRLAQEAGVSPNAVKAWFAGKWPPCRQGQLRELLIRHIDNQQKQLDRIRQQLQ